MKQIVLTFALILTLSLATNAKTIVKDTESFTISTMESTSVDASWIIEYSQAANNIEVFKVNTKKGEEYVVRNQFFEVRYLNTEKGFGVRSIKNNQRKIDATITTAVINTNAMQNQSTLSSKKLSEEKALSYIAGFVPHLLNDNYKHLLN